MEEKLQAIEEWVWFSWRTAEGFQWSSLSEEKGIYWENETHMPLFSYHKFKGIYPYYLEI